MCVVLHHLFFYALSKIPTRLSLKSITVMRASEGTLNQLLLASESAPLVLGFELRTHLAIQGRNYAASAAGYRFAFEGLPIFAVAGSKILLIDPLVLGDPSVRLCAWR